MTRRGAVRLELIILLVDVAFEVQRPIGLEMFGDAPLVVLRPADHMIDDASGAYSIGVVSCGIRHG